MTGALEDVTVLDLSRVLAGPFCGMLLADFGATVIKIEQPGKGDDSRNSPPFIRGMSSYYLNLNRNKLGMTLDLKSPEGKEIFLKLVKQADVVLENFRPGVMDRLGLGYASLKEVNPALVYGCVSGFGQYGPYRDRAGYDIIGQAVSGLMSITGWPDGQPTRSGTAISDVLGGLSVTIGILTALHEARRTGQGQMVDVSLVDSTVAGLEIVNQIYLVEGRIPGRLGNRYESLYPYDSFRCQDGEIVIGCGNNKLFGALAAYMGMPELTTDERFCTNPLRLQNCGALKEIIESVFLQKSKNELIEGLLACGIPASPINTIADAVNDPHIAGAREMFVPLPHPMDGGSMRVTGNHIKLSRTGPSYRKPAPLLGEDTDRLLEKIGYSQETLAELHHKGVI